MKGEIGEGNIGELPGMSLKRAFKIWEGSVSIRRGKDSFHGKSHHDAAR